MIQIQYARDQANNLVHIKEVTNTDKNYQCPQCGVDLVPKLGKINQHHFAHRKNSCIGSLKDYTPNFKYVPRNLTVEQYDQWYYSNLKDQITHSTEKINEAETFPLWPMGKRLSSQPLSS